MTDDLQEGEHTDFRKLCAAVGFVVLNWSHIEQNVDAWVSIAFQDCDGKRLRKKEDIPRSLDNKLDFLKDGFKKLPALNSYSDEGLGLLARVKSLSELRHNLVHGTIRDISPQDGVFHFQLVEYNRQHHRVKPFSFGPSDFSKLEKSLQELLTDQSAFSARLAAKFRA